MRRELSQNRKEKNAWISIISNTREGGRNLTNIIILTAPSTLPTSYRKRWKNSCLILCSTWLNQWSGCMVEIEPFCTRYLLGNCFRMSGGRKGGGGGGRVLHSWVVVPVRGDFPLKTIMSRKLEEEQTCSPALMKTQACYEGLVAL